MEAGEYISSEKLQGLETLVQCLIKAGMYSFSQKIQTADYKVIKFLGKNYIQLNILLLVKLASDFFSQELFNLRLPVLRPSTLIKQHQ